MIVDTNVLLDLLDAEELTMTAVATLSLAAKLYVNEIIFAEIASRYQTLEAINIDLDAYGLTIMRLRLEECHRAGQAFREYRRRNGLRSSILPDFLIGAQAELRGWPILTRDRKGFESYFPTVELIDPHKADHD